MRIAFQMRMTIETIVFCGAFPSQLEINVEIKYIDIDGRYRFR